MKTLMRMKQKAYELGNEEVNQETRKQFVL